MTQQEIEVFLAVVRLGSVSGAAQALYITQPAVSRHLRALERELDCSLLEDFLSWRDSWSDSWAIVPAMVALALRDKCGVEIRTLEEAPPDEIIYYLLGPRRKRELIRAFLDCLARELARHPELESYLTVSQKPPCQTGADAL